MLCVYDKNDKSIVICKATNFQTHGIRERQDIEKWIEDNPQLIGEELLIISKEFSGFDKTDERLDLLAIDRSGHLVVIELKRDDSGRSVDMQAVKYAAYCSTLTVEELDHIYADYLRSRGQNVSDESAHERIGEFVNEPLETLDESPRIVLVAREYRPEVTATVLWLRKKDIDIRCVKLDLHELDSGRLGISSSLLIPVPETEEFVIRAERKEIAEATTTKRQAEYIAFYTEIKRELELRLRLQLAKPYGLHYFQIPSTASGVHFELAFHGRPRSGFGVELHFERGNKEANKKALTSFESLKEQIETAVGGNVIYQSDWGSKWSRLYIERPGGEITDELKTWAIDTMEKFYNMLNPETKKLASLE